MRVHQANCAVLYPFDWRRAVLEVTEALDTLYRRVRGRWDTASARELDKGRGATRQHPVALPHSGHKRAKRAVA